MKCSYFIKGVILAGALVQLTAADWFMPYQQPAKYDYSSYYDPALKATFQNAATSPDILLKNAWEHYKKTFVMSNGLVRHQKYTNTTVSGTNDAVSEGIGYGLLLALINNDQATFDKIFNGANANMWNKNGHQSYDCWDWSNGSCRQTGAATDGDIDIGLALVFADRLQELSYWNKNTAYGSRAKTIISSIKSTMVSGDVLLPGDTWGGDGVNNVNPSYFSTAAMRIFDSYTGGSQYSGVINKCYSILQATKNYSKGQAPDWCTSSGGQGGKSYDMGVDAIRTPYRIGMDAIWFDNSSAKTYCKNSQKSLTKYTSADVTSQMILYSSNGSPSTDASMLDNFDYIAMWCSAVLGSKDKTYTTKTLTPAVVGAIIGQPANGFFGGYPGDQYWYYKQSLSMLGFALITGLFPNVLDDLKGGALPKNERTVIDPENEVTLTEGLAAAPRSADFNKGPVIFTAAFNKETAWKIILTGPTSKRTETLSGTGTTVSASWVGEGWNTIESVAAVLSATNLSATTSANSLKATVTVIKPITAVVSGLSLQQLDSRFALYQNGSGLALNAGNSLLPQLTIYRLNGEKVFSYRFDMNSAYNQNHLVPIPAGRLIPGQYIAQLSGSGNTVLSRRFVWQ